MPLKLKETNISNKHNRLKNPNWWEADQSAIYMYKHSWLADELAVFKYDQGVELGSITKQLQLSGESGTWNT